MNLPEDTRHRLTLWCSSRVAAQDRNRRQIAYTIHGNAVTITERRAPLYPELDMAWTTHPWLRLHRRETGEWALHHWNLAAERWERSDLSGDDPVTLLEHLVQAPA